MMVKTVAVNAGIISTRSLSVRDNIFVSLYYLGIDKFNAKWALFMANIESIIFDLDGTLVDSQPAAIRSTIEALRNFGKFISMIRGSGTIRWWIS
ncbi:MAG: hypothetical protein CM1200mP35_05080 [Chloroflexota bacterium]|nr:MAG: hypothetical protein CM1200mP35_05080 [Chloroflexota bacterium]